MALHLIKLCVGADSIDDLVRWIRTRVRQSNQQMHVTRQTPKRAAELLDGGSLYWVIKGQVACRQKLIDIRPAKGEGGVPSCGLVLEPQVVPVVPRPRGPFQGWRYFEAKDAPPDLTDAAGGDLPPDLAKELALLGLL